MTETRDFASQTDIPFISVMNGVTWNQHLNQIKFDLKQIVLLSDTFNSTMNSSLDKIFYDIFHTIEQGNSETFPEIVTEKLTDIISRYSGFKTALMTLLRNYSTNRTAMFNDLDRTNSVFLNNFRSQSIDSDEIGLFSSGEKIKNDLRMIVNVINFYEFDFNDDLAEHFHEILSFAVKTCKNRSQMFDNTGAFPQILLTIKRGVHFSSVTNYSGDTIVEHTESDRTLQKSSIDSLNAKTVLNNVDEYTEVENDLLMTLKTRSEKMTTISNLIEKMREKMKQRVSV
ncbi:uncharacterized protein LOC111064205 isoform X2 [Nilaparvata lugens]|uniref:uncharacterized protein LOC111064205 isoform X2 n=1 Tax=Nilaparvata lugens TaxID=108931 RepID=UPI00193D2526|nr:uncharacterized protein LOC111064205 isoform X2 [Nilaparvata lugens]